MWYLLKESNLTKALNSCKSIIGLDFDNYVVKIYANGESAATAYTLLRTGFENLSEFTDDYFNTLEQDKEITISIKYSGRVAKTGSDINVIDNRVPIDGIHIWKYDYLSALGDSAQEVDSIIMFDPHGLIMSYFTSFKEQLNGVRIIAFDDYMSAADKYYSRKQRVLYCVMPNVVGESGDSFSGQFELTMPISTYLRLISK